MNETRISSLLRDYTGFKTNYIDHQLDNLMSKMSCTKIGNRLTNCSIVWSALDTMMSDTM